MNGPHVDGPSASRFPFRRDATTGRDSVVGAVCRSCTLPCPFRPPSPVLDHATWGGRAIEMTLAGRGGFLP
jgi:hypothetical protein